MSERDPVYYVWSEYAVNLRPSELAASRANPRIRAAESKTHCRVEFTRRVLNRRQSVTDWSRLSIIRITGPDDQSIAQCNRLLEQIIPAYHLRQEYPRRAPITVYSKNVEAEGDLRSRLSSVISHRTAHYRRSGSGGDKISAKGWQASEPVDKSAIYQGTEPMYGSPKTDVLKAIPSGSKVNQLLTRELNPKAATMDSTKTVDTSYPPTKFTLVSPKSDVLTTKSSGPNVDPGPGRSKPGLERISGKNKEDSKIAEGSVTPVDTANPVARLISVPSEPDVLMLNSPGPHVTESLIPMESNRSDENALPIDGIPNDPSGRLNDSGGKDYCIIQVASEHSAACAITSESASFRPHASFEDSIRSKGSPGVLDERSTLSVVSDSKDPVPKLAAEHTRAGSGLESELANQFDVNQIVPKMEVDLGNLAKFDGISPLELTVSVEFPLSPESGLELAAGGTELVDEIQPVQLSFSINYTGTEIEIAVLRSNELLSLLGTATLYLTIVSHFHRAFSDGPNDPFIGSQVKSPDQRFLENIHTSDDHQSLAILPYPLPGVPVYRWPDSTDLVEGSALPSAFAASSDALLTFQDVGQDTVDSHRETPDAMRLPVGCNESFEMGNCLFESVLNETDPADTANTQASALGRVDSAHREPEPERTVPLGSPTTINTNLEVSMNPETGCIGLEFEISGSPIFDAPADGYTSFTAEWRIKLERNALFGPVGSFSFSPSNN